MAKDGARAGWSRNICGKAVTKTMKTAKQQNKMTAMINYSKDTDKSEVIPDCSLQIEFLIGLIPELELSS